MHAQKARHVSNRHQKCPAESRELHDMAVSLPVNLLLAPSCQPVTTNCCAQQTSTERCQGTMHNRAHYPRAAQERMVPHPSPGRLPRARLHLNTLGCQPLDTVTRTDTCTCCKHRHHCGNTPLQEQSVTAAGTTPHLPSAQRRGTVSNQAYAKAETKRGAVFA